MRDSKQEIELFARIPLFPCGNQPGKNNTYILWWFLSVQKYFICQKHPYFAEASDTCGFWEWFALENPTQK